MAGLHWTDAYNFARVNPGWTSTGLLFTWPLFIALAAVSVVLSPLLFPGAMIISYMLKATNAPALEKPKPWQAVAGPAGPAGPAGLAGPAGPAGPAGLAAAPTAPPASGYLAMYPEVAPKAELGA